MHIISCCCWCARIVLRFDGSYRAWNDPGLPKHDAIVRTSACSASLSVFRKEDQHHHVLRQVGGKRLDPSPIQTSGHAEYEGLLLGLEMVADLLARQRLTMGHQELVIQGDCRTVIQQLQGRARARRMDAYYKRADLLLSRIKDSVQRHPARDDEDDVNNNNNMPMLNIKFQHVPRTDNYLCDKIAAQVVRWQLEQAERSAWENLESARHQASLDGSLSFGAMEHLWRKHLKHVPYSRRLLFYQSLAEILLGTDDYQSLVDIGEAIERELKSTWTRRSKADKKDIKRRLAMSLTFQLIGLKRLGKCMMADRRRQKNISLLRRHANLVEHMERVVDQKESSSSVLEDSQLLSSSPLLTNSIVLSSSTCSGDDDEYTRFVNQWTSQAFTSSDWMTHGCFILSFDNEGSAH